jgi:hypothetical protein
MSDCKKSLQNCAPRQKLAAQMNGAMAGQAGWARGFIVSAAAAAFLWAGLLSVSPELHERVHPDANRVQHSCAVTCIASGEVHHSAPPLFIDGHIQDSQSSENCFARPQWVPPLFLGARIFEHAPPACA